MTDHEYQQRIADDMDGAAPKPPQWGVRDLLIAAAGIALVIAGILVFHAR